MGAAFRVQAQSYASQYKALINRQYANALELKQVGGGYIGNDFQLTIHPTVWVLQVGEYKGKVNGHAADLQDYWIFTSDGKKCWQAQQGNGPLKYWNEDGKATGFPKDWELFRFVPVDAAHGTVKICNTWSGSRLHSGGYVGLSGNSFNCESTFDNAAVFKVGFIPNALGITRFKAQSP